MKPRLRRERRNHSPITSLRCATARQADHRAFGRRGELRCGRPAFGRRSDLLRKLSRAGRLGTPFTKDRRTACLYHSPITDHQQAENSKSEVRRSKQRPNDRGGKAQNAYRFRRSSVLFVSPFGDSSLFRISCFDIRIFFRSLPAPTTHQSLITIHQGAGVPPAPSSSAAGSESGSRPPGHWRT